MSIKSPLWLYAPLWGASFDNDSCGVVGGSTLALIPGASEWFTIQKSSIANERLRVYRGEIPAAAIPLCLSVFMARETGETVQAGAKRIGASMIAQVRCSVLALRLFKAGWFMDPELAELTFIVDENRFSLWRMPGPYRQAFLAPGAVPPLPGYELSIADLGTPKIAGHSQQIWAKLGKIYQKPGSAPLEIALGHFNRSYGFTSLPTERLAYLFMALEAVLGTFNDIVPGLPSKISAGKIYRRLKQALINSGLDPIAAGREAAWLCGGKPEEGRWLRNCVAHGDDLPGGLDFVAVQLRVQEIVRRTLRTCLDFFCMQAPEFPAHELLSNGLTPIGVFNQQLIQAKVAGT